MKKNFNEHILGQQGFKNCTFFHLFFSDKKTGHGYFEQLIKSIFAYTLSPELLFNCVKTRKNCDTLARPIFQNTEI